MSRNVGFLDQFVRLVVGLGLLALVFTGPKTYWGLLGLIPLVTAAAGYCPLYGLFGLNTCKRPPAAQR